MPGWVTMSLGLLLAAGPGERFTRVAEGLVAAMNAEDGAAAQKLFAPVMQQHLPAEKATELFRGLIRQRGKVTKVGEPLLQRGGARLRLTCERGAWEMSLALDGTGAIIGLWFGEPAPEIPVPERNSIPLRLPFREEWAVFWGGATKEVNQHVVARGQRRAADFLIQDAQGKSHKGDGKRNEDYFCYAKDILAPADGTVVTAIDGVPDCVPGSMNPFSAVGNCVVLKHAEHEFSILAHLLPYSLKVKPGEAVKAGQVLGKCGNSGNSSEPHLHFHLQNTAVFQDGTGFAPYFQSVRLTRGGQTTVEKEWTPLKGDRVQPEWTGPRNTRKDAKGRQGIGRGDTESRSRGSRNPRANNEPRTEPGQDKKRT